MADWLDAAQDAANDAYQQRPGSPDEARLLHIASTHALIAVAEGLRAVVGALIAIPTDEDTGDHGPG